MFQHLASIYRGRRKNSILLRFRILGYYKLLFNMQGYEDGPPGDEYYSRACGENGGAYRHFPPLPPGWAPAASQHAAPTKVKLPPFWA